MTSSILENKGSLDPLVLETRDLISRIKKHIIEDKCKCCKEALHD